MGSSQFRYTDFYT